MDGTFINVFIHNADKSRFRNRKGQITTNTLAACDRHMRFTYVLPGWEGSVGDARALQDAVNRPNGLHVPVVNHTCYVDVVKHIMMLSFVQLYIKSTTFSF